MDEQPETLLMQPRILLATSALYCGAVVAAALWLGAKASDFLWVLPSLLSTALFMGVIFALAAVIVYIREIIRNRSIGKDTSARVNAIYNESMTAARLLPMLPFLGVATLVFLGLSIGKSLIVHTVGYSADPMLANFDKALHSGYYPHDLIASVIETWNLVPLLNFCYYFWFGILMLSVWCAAFLKQDEVVRMRFWWSLQIIILLLGGLLAFALPSVGPIYYADFYTAGAQPYEEYLTHLRNIDETVIRLQSFQVSDILLALSRDESIVDLNGISAMPSLHVALAFLFFLYLRQFGRWIGAFAFLFFMFIFIGSVYFAWHYAVDGYAGIIGTALIWWGSGKILTPKK